MSDSRYPGMTKARYKELTRDIELKLSQEEINAGWHFCYDWDWMLIHTSWDEFQGCTGCGS